MDCLLEDGVNDWKLISRSIFTISGKIGYGTVSEALAFKLPFVFVRRDYFNEEPFLRNMLEVCFSFSPP